MTAVSSNRNSILIQQSITFPIHPSPAPSTSSSSASSTSSHTSIRTPNRSGSLGPPSHRRIRFAPLPDPRRDGDEDDDSNSNNLVVDDIEVEPISKRHSYPFIDDESCSSSAPSDTDSLPPSLCTTPIPTKPTTHQLLSHTPIPAPSWTRPKSLSLLRPFPFKKSSPSSSASSSHSLTPTPSLDKDSSTPTPTNSRSSPSWSKINFSTEEILTLGAVNLFRPSSKNNGSSTATSDTTPVSPPSSWGLGLTRWSSAGSAAKVGSPLGRTTSTQSYTSTATFGLKPVPKSAKKPRSNSSASAPSTAPAAAGKSTSLPARKGTRMLNGRVYGGPKRNPDANPFANARDDDPEFVEWGYGGMGSVRGAHHAGVAGAGAAQDKERTRWERLHSDGRGVVVGSFAEGEKKGVGGVPGVTADEDDDGSGMGWVKKRREAREREKKEREEKEKAEAEAAKLLAVPAVEEPAAPIERVATPEQEPEPVPEPPTLVRQPSTAPSVAPSATEHNLKTVTLPANLHHHSHRRTQSRTASTEGAPNGLVGELSPAPPSGLKETTVAREISSSESESESETEAESPTTRVSREDDDEDGDEDDDEDEEDAEQEKARMTALGAGVEKISRHN